MSDLVDVISGFSKRLREPHIGAYAEELAREIENAGYTPTGLTEAQGVISITVLRGIINGFINQARCDIRRETAREILAALESMIGVGTGRPEKPVRRVVQIAIAQGWTIPAEKLSFVPEVIQLCDDGSVWTCALDSMKQRRLPPIPADDA